MNYWTELSIEYANQRSYLDDLFTIYPTIPEGIRSVNEESWELITTAFHDNQQITLLQELLKLDLFPIKDSYIAFLKRDKNAIFRNPNTVSIVYVEGCMKWG